MTTQKEPARQAEAGSPPSVLTVNAILVAGIGALFSSLLIYSGAFISFIRLPGMVLRVGTFAETLLLAATLCAAAAVVLALKGCRISTMALGAFAGIAYLASALAFGFVGYFALEDPLIYLVLGCVTAAAEIGLVLVWGRVCSRLLSIRRALTVVGLGSAAAAAICFLYGQLPLEWALGLYFVAAAAAVIAPLALQGILPATEGAELPETQRRPSRQVLASLVDVALAPGLGLITFAFVMAIMRTAFNEGQVAYLSMMTAASLGLVLYAALKKGRFLLPGALQLTFLPVAAMVLLAIIAITATVGAGEPVATWATYGLYSFAAVLTLATLCAVGHAGEFPSDLVFSVALFAFCGTSFVGQSVAPLLGDELISVAVTVSTTVYAFALVLVSYLRRGTERDAERAAVGAEAEEARNPSAGAAEGGGARAAQSPAVEMPSLEERCARLAEAHGLTAREHEILTYLAEGHNGSYIASALFISPNTARTHIHNIYRKLDVSSREDVLRLTR